MISPTGLWIRNDAGGYGHYGASRGNHPHRGTDFNVDILGNVLMPVDGFITRAVQVYSGDDRWRGCEIQARRARIHLYYMLVFDYLIGKEIKKGEIIGKPQDISLRYSSGDVTAHVHFEIKDCDPLLFMEIL